MCPVYDVPFRYFIPLNTYAGAHRSTSLSHSLVRSPPPPRPPAFFFSLSLSRTQSLRRTTLPRNPRVTFVSLEVSALESVHSSLRSFSFRGVSYDLLSNHATGSKYSFATNFHLHVSSPLACPVPQPCVLSSPYTVPLLPTPFYSFAAGWYYTSQRWLQEN